MKLCLITWCCLGTHKNTGYLWYITLKFLCIWWSWCWTSCHHVLIDEKIDIGHFAKRRQGWNKYEWWEGQKCVLCHYYKTFLKTPKKLQIKSCRLNLTLRLKTSSPNFDSNNENKFLVRWGGKNLSQVIPHVSSGSRILKGPQTLCHDLWGQQFKTIAFIIIWIEITHFNFFTV